MASAAQQGAVELKVGDVTIRVERDADVRYVAALVATIRRTCSGSRYVDHELAAASRARRMMHRRACRARVAP